MTYLPAGLGAADATANFALVLAQQVNDARRQFGNGPVNMPGTVTPWPNMNGDLFLRLDSYWGGEAARALATTSGKVQWAGLDQWKRAVESLGSLVYAPLRYQAKQAPQALLPGTFVASYWKTLMDVATPMGAVLSTPSKWETFKSAVAESLPENPLVRGASNLITAAKWLGMGLIAYVAYDAIKGR